MSADVRCGYCDKWIDSNNPPTECANSHRIHPAYREDSMNHFALARGYVVTANADGSIPLSSKVIAELSAADEGVFVQMLIAQANVANDLLAALRGVRDTLLIEAGLNKEYGWAEYVRERLDPAIAKAEGK